MARNRGGARAGGEIDTARLVDRLAQSGAKPSRYPSKLARLSHIARPSTGWHAAARHRGVHDRRSTNLRRRPRPAPGQRPDPRHPGGDPPAAQHPACVRQGAGPGAVAGIEDELKWFASELGEVRDCQVQRRRFQAALAQLPPELVLGPVANRINNDLQSDQLRARGRVTDAMGSHRYLELLATLQRWRTTPPIAAPPTVQELTGAPAARTKSRPAAGHGDRDRRGRAVTLGTQGRQTGPIRRRTAHTGGQERKANSEALQAISDEYWVTTRTARLRRRHCYGWGRWRERRMARTVSPSGCCTRRSSKPQQTRAGK